LYLTVSFSDWDVWRLLLVRGRLKIFASLAGVANRERGCEIIVSVFRRP